MVRALLAAAVVIAGITLASMMMYRHPVWTPDGWHYARMMLEDRGETAPQAKREATSFFLRTEVGRSPAYREAIERDPTGSFTAVGAFFKQRVLYPLLAAPLYGTAGIGALIIVSLIAYVIAGFMVYLLLLMYAQPGLAALGALIFLVTPAVRSIGSSSLVDMLATTIWFVILYSMLRYVRTSHWLWLALFTMSCLALCATRPLIYLPFAAALLFVAVCVLRRDATGFRAGAALGAASLSIGVGYVAIGARMGAPSLSEDLMWMYRRDVETGAPLPHALVPWYLMRLVKTAMRAAFDALRYVLPVAGTAGFVLRPPREWPIFAGAVAGSLFTLLLDPDSGDLARTFEIPLYPIALIGVAIAWDELRQRSSRGVVQRPVERGVVR